MDHPVEKFLDTWTVFTQPGKDEKVKIRRTFNSEIFVVQAICHPDEPFNQQRFTYNRERDALESLKGFRSLSFSTRPHPEGGEPVKIVYALWREDPAHDPDDPSSPPSQRPPWWPAAAADAASDDAGAWGAEEGTGGG